MASKTSFATLVLMVVAAATLIDRTTAAVYFVGDTLGWTIPSTGATVYSDWVSNHTFAVGDTLVFNFAAGAHDVARVTNAAFDTCNSNSPLFLQTLPPVNFTLNSSGGYYFICTFGRHCANGQKLALNVSTASPSPSPSPTSPSPSPTSPSPAPSPAGTTSPPPPLAPSSPPSASTPGTPPSDTNTTSPPPPSSAPPKTVATFGIMVMSIAIVFMFV